MCCIVLIIFHIKNIQMQIFNIEAYKSNIDKDNDGIDDPNRYIK